MANGLKVGVLIPNGYPDNRPNPEELLAFFKAADRFGFHSLWATERPLHRVGIVQPFTMLAAAAAVTSRINLGTAVVLASLRHPIHLANESADVDYLSGGRLLLGIALGGRPPEFEALGIPINRRMGRLEESITLLRRLWSEPEVSFEGRHFKLENVSLGTRPARDGKIPIYLAGASEPALRRAGALGDGWVAGGAGTPEEMGQRCQAIKSYAVQAGRDPGSMDMGKIIYTCIDDDKAAARERMAWPLTQYYGPQFDIDGQCAFGPPAECAEYIRPYVEAGVNMPLVGLPWPDVNQLQRLHEEVVPLLS